jgi:Tol biopolymer transport system component
MAWLSMERDGYEADRNRIFVMDLATGQKEELTVDFDQNAANLSWSPKSDLLYLWPSLAEMQPSSPTDALATAR